MVDEQVITVRQADAMFARYVGQSTSATRAALNDIIPKPSQGTIPTTSVAQVVKARSDGTWTNPVRDANTGGRVYVGAHVASPRTPTQSDGLAVGDVYVGKLGTFVASVVPTTGVVTWVTASGGTGGSTTNPGTGTGTTDPVDPGTGGPIDPGPTNPPPPGDTSTPSPTSRPFALLGTVGVWTTTGGTTLIQALSDQHLSTASATPPSSSQGAAVTLDMSNFAHAAGNDLTVTLWGVASSQPGPVTVTVGYQGSLYAPAKTLNVTAAAQDLAFTWKKDDTLSLPVSQWRDVEVTISRPTGGFTVLADVTLQSVTPKVDTIPGTNLLSPTAILWAPSSVWYSDLSKAPVAKANTAAVAYVRGQGAWRLDCYSDAPPMWMVTSTTPRVQVTPPATSTRGDVALMRRSDGKGALDGVPIPNTAVPPANVFKTAIIGCVETRQVWELLGLTKTGTTWSAEWGGRIDDVPNSGGAMPTNTGYTGSGLSFTAAAIKVAEAKDAAAGNTKAITHALGLNLNYDTASNEYCWPATRSDGTSYDAGAPKMGQRLRLKASADLSACTPIGKAVGEALKRYGAVVLGGAAKIGLVCESGAVEQAATGVDPWGAILAGKTVDTALTGLPLDQLEVVSPGWGGPGWKEETTTTTPPTDPNPPTTPPASGRRAIYINSGVKWLSGASCRAIEKGSEGMGSTYATWRGEPCYMARCWADAGGKATGEEAAYYYYSLNDWTLSSVWVMYNNWHASMDIGVGFFGRTENMAAAARGEYEPRWTATLKKYREWWASRKDPSKVNAFISPAHEMNGSWYPWAVNSGNYKNFITAWKRYRTLQLKHFPEAFFCFNANRDTAGSDMDWRRMVAGYEEGGVAAVKQWVDVGGVDYYNMDPNSKTAAEWSSAIQETDKWGAPKGLEKHRQFWASCGLPLQIPEWSNNASQGDSPYYAIGMNDFMRKWAGTGAGQICADALFNLTEGYPDGRYAVTGDTVGSPQFAAKYRELTWGY